MAEQLIFYMLAAVIAFFSIMAVTTKRIIRSATFLLLVLLAVAGLYLLLGYQYLMTVQIAVYAGGIMALFIFAILLTHKPGESAPSKSIGKRILIAAFSVAGLAFCTHIIVCNASKAYNYFSASTPDIKQIGLTMMGTGKYQYLLAFEAISILILACIIGGIMIARRR
ncbi:MAG: NADH-quinone oxidoreductase subunit J [Prevotellaceae bacterium]|jgi:NADH-quinone oxidoreductase subunit J|nr:NADH-quinone oxidoreductase subunit J [Prevotellaceae bacterium]